MPNLNVRIDQEKEKARRRANFRTSHVYHVSPSRNRDSIMSVGIEPALFSKGKQKTCWYVDADRVMWALVHCARRHGVQLDQLDVWIVPVDAFKRLSRTHMRGVYQSACVIKTRTFMSAWVAETKQAEWLEFLS